MAQYTYKPYDYFYDIESFNTYNHLFMCAFLEPYKRNGKETIILSYYSSDTVRQTTMQKIDNQYYVSDLLKNPQFRTQVETKIQATFKDLNRELKDIDYQIIWEDLSKVGYAPTLEEQKQGFQAIYGLQTFIQRLGLPEDLVSKQKQYIATYDFEKEEQQHLNGYLFAYNSHNYDETMLSLILQEVLASMNLPIVQDQLYAHLQERIACVFPMDDPRTKYMLQFIQGTFQNNGIFANPVEIIKQLRMHLPLSDEHCMWLFQTIADIELPLILNERVIRENMNDLLFDAKYKQNMKSVLRLPANKTASNIYNQWKRTGRYIDITVMVENARTALKRLLGVKGFRIQESEHLSGNTQHIPTVNDLIDDIVYNVSDVIGERVLFEDPFYQAKFTVKADTIKEYKYLVFDENGRVKWFNRQTADSTSAKMIEHVIAKDGEPLTDIPVVDFTYPSPHAIRYLKSIPAYKNKDIQPTDILEDSLEWFVRNVCRYTGLMPKKETPRYNFILKKMVYDFDIEQLDFQMKHTMNQKQYQAFLAFKDVYCFYDCLRGKNLNQSEKYLERLLNTYLKPEHLSQTPDAQMYYNYIQQINVAKEFQAWSTNDLDPYLEKFNTNIFYFDQDCNPTSCFATFALGGIHGQEINKEVLTYEPIVQLMAKQAQNELKATYKTAKNAYAHKEEWAERLPIDLLLNVKDERISWKSINEKPATITLFKKSKKKDKERYELDDKYKYISTGKANHEDFTSYYPMLIVNLAIFQKFKDYDPNKPIDLSEPYQDNYLEIYIDRARLKAISKDKNYDQETREEAGRKQETKKLLLNSGSGAADASYDTLIRKNNAIISMRIIGQLFAHRIGQAQSLAGARVPSTNTDGLYTMGIDETLNNQILETIAENMYIGIEPEIVDNFISKDSNNRLEIVENKRKNTFEISDAKGGTLTSYKRPQIAKNIDHPAIIDHWLALYLWKKPNAVNEPFDRDFASTFIQSVFDDYNQRGELNELLRMYQWIIASSPSTMRYAIQRKSNGMFAVEQPLQHYNRLFLTQVPANQQPTTFALVTKQTLLKRSKKMVELEQLLNKPNRTIEDNQAIKQLYPYSDATAYHLLSQYGADLSVFNKTTLSDEEIARMNADDLKPYKAILTKIKSLDTEQNGEIINENIMIYTDEQALQLLNRLDYQAYLDLLEETFTKSWQNLTIDPAIKEMAKAYQVN